MDQTKSHRVLHCKPKCQLPPLQLAIKENNFAAIESLLKRNYDIVFEDNEKHVILSEDEKDLPIQLLYISDWRFNKTFHVGFRYMRQNQIHWVVADLPGLEKVRIVAGSKVHTITTNNIQEMILPLVQCRSPRPLFAAFRGLIEPDAQLKNKSFLRDLVCKSGSEQVVVEYITEFGEVIFKEIDKFLSMIKSAIDNPKVLGYLLTASSNLQTSDSFNPAHKQLISKCLCKCLELSIECNGVAALQILLLHHSCVINSLYEEKSDTLLQLALRKKGKIEFIKCILKALSDKTEDNLTHIKQGISEMIPLIDWKNTDNHTALHICVQNECKEDIDVNTAILEELLSSNARINYTDEGADTIVHFIVKKRKAPILAFKILMKIHHISDHALTHFGDLPFLDAKDKDGKTAIHVCIENRNKDLLKTLLTFVHDTLSQDPNGDTALHLAVYTQDLEFVEIVNFYIERKIIEARNNKGYTALHCAINYAKNTIADHLLKCGADFFTTDDNKQSILHHAIKLLDAHCKQMIEYIIAYNNEPIITKMFDKDKNCPLHLAVILQNIIAVKILLDWDSSILCCKEKDNRSVLHLSILVESRNPVREEILDYILEKIKFLEENDDQWLCNRVINYQDNFQKTVLHYCILHNNGSALMKLLALSPDLGLEDNLGNTPLHQAVLNHEHVSLLQPLLDSIKDNNELKYSSNLSSFRPLQKAILLNNFPAIKTLINDQNNFQLAYPPDSDTQTLCDGIGLSSLRFLSKITDSTSKYTGYLVKYCEKEYWIMAKLPELKVTEYIISVDCFQYSELSIEEVLLSVLECISQDPLKAVFENNMCQVNEELSNGFSLSQFTSQHSTRSVMEYYLTKDCTTLHTFPPNRRSMIESSICNTKNINTIRLLLSQVNTDNPDVKKCFHNSLEISLANEGEEALSLLLEYTSALNDSYGPKNDTLLHLIVENNKASTFISCLLDKVEDIESKTPQSTFISNSPFIDVRNSDSKTAIHIVIENEDMKNLSKLIEYGPSLKIPDDRGDTPLHYAVYTNNIDIVGVILDQINRDNPEIKELKNIQGCTPLHSAVFMKNVEITELLIEKGCNFLATDCVGRTMLHYAVIIPQSVQTISKMVNYILKHDELHHNHILLKSTDFKKHTPLHLAVIEKQELVIDQILEAIDNAELKFGTSWIVHRVICYQDCEQKTALHLSIQYTNFHALNVLLNTDPCLDLADHNKNSILHTATINPSDECSVKRILESIKRRFQRNFEDYLYEARNDQNLTPLQFAIKNGHIFAVKAMVEEDTQIAYKRENKTTLNFTENLPLHFFRSKTEEFYIGYSFMPYGNSQDENFVICRLPLPSENIPKTEIRISNPSEVHKINLDSQELLESLLQQIFKSQTEEPLQAFHFLCDLTTMTELSNQSTLLHFAAQFGTEQVMEYLIEKSKVDCDFKATDGNGNGIFHRAIHNEIDNVHFLIEKVKELVVANGDEFSKIIDIKNRNGLCALDTALAADSKDVFLKYTKEDYNAKLNYYDPTGNTLLHKIVLKNDKNTETYLEVLLDAIRDRKKMNSESTFINGVALIDCYSWKCEQEYYTALQLSNLVGNLTALEILFRYGANILLTTMHSGFSIIHLAILHQQNNPEYLHTILVECIEKKEPSLFNRKDLRGSHWLDYYLENGTVPIVSLQSTYDIEKYITGRPCTTFGVSPLHLAISQESYECVKILLQGLNGPINEECTQASYDQLYVRDPNGYTALHYATLLNCEEAAEIIVKLFETESSRFISDRSILTQRCNKGTTPLHTAISKGSYLQITQSTESAAKSILDTMLHYSTKFNSDGIFMCYLDNISYLDNYNRSILHHAVITKNDEIFRTVFECVKQYIHFADLLNLQDYDGKTALHLAVEYDYLFAFQEIVKLEPALNLRDKVNHWTVLHSIIGNNHDEIFFNDYLKGNSNLDLMDVKGLTALHLAIKQKRTKFVNELMAIGAKLSIEIGEIGCGMYTVGASVEKELLLLGRTEGETHLQSNKYIVAYKVEAEFLFSTLPELSDSESAENKRGFLREKDVEFEKLSVEETESLISSCFASKCPELVEKLIELGKIDFTGDTKLMHLAAQHASLPVMKFLCEEKQPGFDYESIDSHGNTLIHCGAKNTVENVETLIYILTRVQEFESKKKKEVSQKILKVRNYKKQSALQITIDSGKIQLFIALIKHGADIKETNQFGNSILHILIRDKNKTEEDIFKNMSDLIEQFKKEESLRGKISDLLNIKNNHGDAVLQIAIEESYKQLIQLFIDNSASLSVIQRNSGNTIVHLLIKNQPDYNTESIEYVLKAVKIHDKERKDDQILDRRNLELCTALHISVQDKKKNVSTKLLLDAGVPIEIPDRDGNTALHIATKNQDYPAVQVIMSHLIRRGKEYRLADRGWEYMKELARQNKKKVIPVCIQTTEEILTCMLQAWKPLHTVSFGDDRRGLLLHLAVYGKNVHLVRQILKAIEEIGKHNDKDLADLIGKVLSTRDSEDLTPLHVAAEMGNSVIGNKLISAGADVQLNSARGTPLEIAMQRDHTDFAISMVEKGANIKKYLNLLAYNSISDKYIEEDILWKNKVNLKRRISSADCTVIHYAAKQSNVRRIELLIRNGIALAASDRDGKRVLHYTIQYRDDYEVMKFFLDEATRRDEFNKDPPNQMTFMEALMHCDLDGITPVMLAAKLDRINFFKLLTTPKYEYLLGTFLACDPNQNNVIHYLAKYKSIRSAELIVKHIQKTKIELFTHIMNGRNIEGQSPIDLARKRGEQKMVDLFVDLCDLEYFEACPDVVHRMVKGGDYANFSKVLDKTVIKDCHNVQISTKLMDSNEEGDYPDFRFFNFHLAPLWHKLYRSKLPKYQYHPVLKFLIDEKLIIYRWWFRGIFLLYLFLFYIPLSLALLFASWKCDSELFAYTTSFDRFRFCLEVYILVITWLFILNEWFEIQGRKYYLENLFFSSNELDYKRLRQVQYSSDLDLERWSIMKIMRFICYEFPIILHKWVYEVDKRSHFYLRAVYQHFRETYNMIDICSVIFLILLFVFRLMLIFFPSTFSVLHWTCSALTFTFFTFKFYKFTKMFPSLGIYIETLSNVLSADVPRFSLVILILLVSYIGSIQLVARSYSSEGAQCSFSHWFGDNTVPFSPLLTPFISGLLFIIDGGPGNYETSFREVPIMFSIFYLVFAFCIIVVLLNVFIAQLSQTYANIYANKDLLDFKTELALDYETQSSIVFKLLSPLRRPLKRILVEKIIVPLKTWKSYYSEYDKRISDTASGSEVENLQSKFSSNSMEIEVQQISQPVSQKALLTGDTDVSKPNAKEVHAGCGIEELMKHILQINEEIAAGKVTQKNFMQESKDTQKIFIQKLDESKDTQKNFMQESKDTQNKIMQKLDKIRPPDPAQ